MELRSPARWKTALNKIETSLTIIFLLLQCQTSRGTEIKLVTPNYGSLEGGTRVTITGVGFSSDNMKEGNEVSLVSDTTEYKCEVSKDATTETSILCFTPPGMVDGIYYIRVTVDGIKVPLGDHCRYETDPRCRFQARIWNTPTITELRPFSGPPDLMLTIQGRIYTDLYRSTNTTADNGKTARIAKVFAAGQQCSLLDGDELYGISLRSNTSNMGEIKCRLNGTYVGTHNASYIVNSFYGRSQRLQTILQLHNDEKIGLFQIYSEIQSVTPSCGSTEGGTLLTIAGRNLNDSTSRLPDTKVSIEGTECDIQSINETHIICVTAAKPEKSDLGHQGNRGLTLETWTQTDTGNTDTISQFNGSESDYVRLWIDQFDLEGDKVQSASRARGYFVAPYTGSYSFHLTKCSNAKLLLSNTSNPEFKREIGTSRVHLNQNESYFMEVLRAKCSKDTTVKVYAHFYDTKLTNASTSVINQEVQKIIISSDVLLEIQNITLTGFGTTTGTKKEERQKIKIVRTSGGDPTFRLGLYNTYTDLLTLESSGSTIAAAIQGIPVLDDNLETVSASVTTLTGGESGIEISVQIASPRGNFPDIQCIANPPSSLTFTVTEEEACTPTGEYLVLQMANVSSPLIHIGDNEATIQAKMVSMTGTRCPKVFGNKGSKIYYDFEDPNRMPTNLGGQRTIEMEAFCGKGSLLNPTYLYRDDIKGFTISTVVNTICFAHYGEITDYFYITVDNGDSTTSEHWFENTYQQTSNKWNYNCIDLENKLKSKELGRKTPIKRLRVFPKDSDAKLYIDEVYIGLSRSNIDPQDRRMIPSKPDNKLIESINVKKFTMGESIVLQVTVASLDCANNIPKFETLPGQLTNAASVQVEKRQAASPAVGGSFSVTFNGTEKAGISPDVNPYTLEQELETAFIDIGDIYVYKHGNCSNSFYSIAFLSKPGDVMSLMVNGGSLTGNDPKIKVETVIDGNIMFNPILGGMLRTYEEYPQVSAKVNKVPTRCSGSCTFEWKSDCTPTVTEITPSEGEPSNTEVTISGTKFDTTLSNNKVLIGGVPCVPKAGTTATKIICDVGAGSGGTFPVEVFVEGKGKAKLTDTSIDFTYLFEVSNISPLTGSLGGGINITLTGYGFSDTDEVSFGDKKCPTVSQTPFELICENPSVTAAATVNITIVQEGGDRKESGSQFTYNTNNMGLISSITPNTSSVAGGATLTISGSNLGTGGSLMIGRVKVETITYTPTEVTAKLPDLPPGSKMVALLGSTSTGLAVKSGSFEVPTILYQFKIQNVYPRRGSLHGGTLLTISGLGFPLDKSVTEVKIGEYGCEIEEQISTQIQCRVGSTEHTTIVDNWGKHEEYGEGFAWRPSHIEIAVGDKVEWKWSYPKWITGLNPRVAQIASEQSEIEVTDGFSSGTGTANGNYQHTFNTPGVFYYWSGYIDGYDTTKFKGSVTVKNRKSTSEQVRLFAKGKYEAEYEINGLGDPDDSGSCDILTAPKSGCNIAEPVNPDNTKFDVKLWECVTPTVTNIDRNDGTASNTITITGTLLSSQTCGNKIWFGDMECVADTVATKCKIQSTDITDVGVKQPIRLRVLNYGDARIEISGDVKRTFTLIPEVTSMNPLSGSQEGGAVVEVEGTGFKGSTNDVVLRLGTHECTVTKVTYTKIEFVSPEFVSPEFVSPELRSGTYALTVSVILPTASTVDAIISISDKFSVGESSTPRIESVTPSSISGSPTELTIEGDKFGSSKSDVAVKVGETDCTVLSVQSSKIQCSITHVKVGENEVKVTIKTRGIASGTKVVYSNPVINTMSPVNGSTYGGTVLTITGNGFDSSTRVTIDDKSCQITMVNLSQVTCKTPPHGADSVNVTVVANGKTYPVQTYQYATSSTPRIDDVTPNVGSVGTVVVVGGQNFADNPTVAIGDARCVVSSSTDTQITCTAGSNTVGEHAVVVDVLDKGISNSVDFTYQLAATSVTPSKGSSAGGQPVTISGSGFSTETTVMICGESCEVTSVVSPSQLICETPSSSTEVTATRSCDVVVKEGSVNKTISNGYEYKFSLTPTISNVEPRRGGTGGGTAVTITGTNFGNVKNDASVTIDDTPCIVANVNPTTITCITESRKRTIKTKVRVEISGNGIADQTYADFEFIDLWSSVFTWNGSLPSAGHLVVIGKGQTILLDTDTPILKMILIQGGALIFDDKDVVLKAEIILVTDGGLFQIGTETEPFQHKAKVILYGSALSEELPVYGTKTIGIRGGKLEFHGKPTTTWTKLASTAHATDDTITLQLEVDWEVGDEIVIATTGNRHSQNENEVAKIKEKSGRTLTLEKPLKYDHLGVTLTVGGKPFEARAEVGLLTHNILILGDSDPQFIHNISACPLGFDPGEFATQTCFSGRHGSEIGSDEFGAHLMLHRAKGTEVTAHLEYVEFKHVGQSFRLGRYPIHFHLNGKVADSYVRGCGIHESFNRAVNIHGTHNVRVEHNVIYNIMGGAFFLEDGIENSNTIQYNLAVFVRQSTSLQNDDITPAAFWITNPNNIVKHNHAAGGSHFGFWYRMHEHPDGPSSNESVCPQSVPLGSFKNNTAHSLGWFGLWSHEVFTPREEPCKKDSKPIPAKFYDTVVWNCEKGIEFVFGGPFQFINFLLVANEKAGLEGKFITGPNEYFNTNGSLISNGIISGSESTLKIEGCTWGGIVLPYGVGLLIDNVTFLNFENCSCVPFTFTTIQGVCTKYCGGYEYHTKNLGFFNSPKRVKFRWTSEGNFRDLDGTLTGNVGHIVVPKSGIFPSTCIENTTEYCGLPAYVCPSSVNVFRLSFNEVEPTSLKFKDVIVTNKNGNVSQPFAMKRLTHPDGYMVSLVSNETHDISFEDANPILNISYAASFMAFKEGEYVIIQHELTDEPDRVQINGNNCTRGIETSGTHGICDWEYDSNTKKLSYTVGSQAVSTYESYQFDFRAYKCEYKDCGWPVDPNSEPPEEERSKNSTYWSQTSTWPSGELPQNGSDVKILNDTWVVADIKLPYMNQLALYGVLELDDMNGTVAHVLNCTYIVIMGGRLIVGWPNKPYLGSALILLTGSRSTPDYPPLTKVGKKTIASFGGLDLHGRPVNVPWTQLTRTANKGDIEITVDDPVDWKTGDQIVIAPTGFSIWHTEFRQIIEISADQMTLKLNQSLQHNHIAYKQTFGGKTLKMKAEVGLLTRNVRVEGAYYNGILAESFGAKILVGMEEETETTYLGFARLQNVQFIRAGQEGLFEPHNAAFAVTYRDGGDVTEARPSYVRNCSFQEGFSPAIGVFGLNGLEAEHNVIVHAVYAGIMSNSVGTQLRGNLLLMIIFEGTYQDRYELTNRNYKGGFELFDASGIVLENNHVAGGERLCFHVPPVPCDQPTTNTYIGNVGHSCLFGIATIPETDFLTGTCAKFSNFTIYKAGYYGVYANFLPSAVIENVIVADSTVGIFPMVYGPLAKEHEFADKTITVKNSLIIGMTSTFDCVVDRLDLSDDNIRQSMNAYPYMGLNTNFNGITIGTFTSGPNAAPKKPFVGIITYNTIKGETNLEDVIFAEFDKQCAGFINYAISTNKKNDDCSHPTWTKGLQFFNVARERRVFLHRPNIGLINIANCVDMDCDGHKKVLINDRDGSLLGSVGNIIAQSEFEWGTNSQRGLDYDRIPKELKIYPNGTAVNLERVYPNKGIIRTDDCTYMDSLQGYICPNTTYRMLMVESMDRDTETRRLSPIAIIGDNYVDLVNGPQDHGWCFGYTCMERLSLFPFLVLTDKEYLLYYTGTAPQHTRFFLLNSDSSDVIVLGIWYSQPYRLDVYVNGRHVKPINFKSETENGRIVYNFPPSDQPLLYRPNASSNAMAGANYYDRNTNLIYITIRGPFTYEIKARDTFIVSLQLPTMTEEDFYGRNIVQNLAAFLNIPPSEVTLVAITREPTTTSKRRKKRSADVNNNVISAAFEIGDPPTENINDTSSNATNDLEEIEENLITAIQLDKDGLAAKLDLPNETTYSIASVPPIPGTPEWAALMSSDESAYTLIEQPDTLTFRSTIAPLHEGSPFSTQPKIQVLNAHGNPIKKLGTNSHPWEITASLRDSSEMNSNARLEGNLTIQIIDGWANFTDLLITHAGNGYVVDFNITYPLEAGNFTIASEELSINVRPLKAIIVSTSSGVVADSNMGITLELRDNVTSEEIPDIAWQGHNWTATAELGTAEHYCGTMLGTMSVPFDAVTGQANFMALKFSNLGVYVVKVRVTSDPPDYDFTAETLVVVISQSHAGVAPENSQQVTLKFEENYDTIIGTTNENYFAAAVGSAVACNYTDVMLTAISITRGSILVTITLEGNLTAVNTTIHGICGSTDSGLSVSFNGNSLTMSSYMEVGGAGFCSIADTASADDDDDDSGVPLYAIVAGVIGGLLILGIVALVMLWKMKIHPKTRTSDNGSTEHLGKHTMDIDEILWREKTFMSIRSNQSAPAATAFEKKPIY